MFSRFVALGDSPTEGMNDPGPSGVLRGWADRLAERLAQLNPDLRYANLAVRGKRSDQVLAEQLATAVSLQPDLASVEVGVNDALRPRFDPDQVARRIQEILHTLADAGARVLVFTLPDPSPFMPVGRMLRPRLHVLNEAIRETAWDMGAALLDLGAYPITSDPRLWSEDRLHGNPLGHERVAEAAAQALGLPGSSLEWTEPLPALPPRSPTELLAAELAWARRYLLPWIASHARGRSAGYGRTAKRPALLPVMPRPSIQGSVDRTADGT